MARPREGRLIVQEGLGEEPVRQRRAVGRRGRNPAHSPGGSEHIEGGVCSCGLGRMGHVQGQVGWRVSNGGRRAVRLHDGKHQTAEKNAGERQADREGRRPGVYAGWSGCPSRRPIPLSLYAFFGIGADR